MSLPPELNEIECNQCHGESFIPCLECGGDGVIECIGCGGMGVVGEEEEECEVEEVEYEYAAEDSGILRYNSYDFPGITVARKPWPEIVARIIES